MNIQRLLGINTQADRYRYASDPDFGYTAEARIPD